MAEMQGVELTVSSSSPETAAIGPVSGLQPYFQRQATYGQRIVQDPPRFDLDQYISNYGDATKFDRLLLIGRCSTVLAADALGAAKKEAIRRRYVKGFKLAAELLAELTQNAGMSTQDMEWIGSAEKTIKAETKRLEDELKGYRNNLIKESIRMSNEELGKFYRKTGQLSQATKTYASMREYCTGPIQLYNMVLKLVLTAIEQKQWLSVNSQLTRLAADKDSLAGELKIIATSIYRCCQGLIQMQNRNYRSAAEHFMTVNLEMKDNFNEVMTVNDVAIYGGLCALASMNRHELEKNVLEKAEFRPFLELEPHVRQTITLFCGAKYGACLQLLDSYKADYLLDLYLSDHVDNIIHIVRKESIIQYFRPFSSVPIKSMATAFSLTEDTMTEELITMITEGRLDGRIDLPKGLLLAKQTNQRTAMQNSTLAMVDRFQRNLDIRLMRMNVARAGLELKGKKEASGRALGRGASNLVEMMNSQSSRGFDEAYG